MTRCSKPTILLLILLIIGVLTLGRMLLRQPPSKWAPPLNVAILWLPTSANLGQNVSFVKDDLNLFARVHNSGDSPAKVFGLSSRRGEDHAPLLTLFDGFVVEPELRDHSGRAIVSEPGVGSIVPESTSIGISNLGAKPWVYELAAGQSIDVPFDPFPLNVMPTKLKPGTLTVVAVLTWLDANTSRRMEVRSLPLTFDYTADDIAKRKARQAASWANAFDVTKW